MLVNGEQAYNTLFAELVRLGDPHIDNFSNADRQTVLKCIKDLTGRFLSEEDFTVYVEREDVDIKKPKIKLAGYAKETLKNYYDAAHHTLCEAQTNFMASTKVLKKNSKIKKCSLNRCSYQQSKCWSEP